MSRDQAIGGLLMLGSIVVCVLYVYAVFLCSPEIALLVLKLTGTVAVLGVFGILAWIGYTLATTPPPPPIEELEKELEKELKEIEKEEEEKEEKEK